MSSIGEILSRAAGLDVAALGAGRLDAAIARRRGATGLDAASWLRRLEEDDAERSALLSLVLVHETWLFRDRVPFELLLDVATRWAGTAGTAGTDGISFRALSLPCATGEEVWSIAATLREAGLDPARFRVLGGDLDAGVLAAAERAIYPRRAFRGTADMRAARHLVPAGDDLVAPAHDLRAAVAFRRVNLLDADPALLGGRFDAVFCRNALVYMDAPARRRVARLLGTLLAPGGLLFVGHSEVAAMTDAGFRPHPRHGSFALVPRADDEAMTANGTAAAMVRPRPAAPRIAADGTGARRHRAAAPGATDATAATETPGATEAPDATEAPRAADATDDLLGTARHLADRGALADAERAVRDALAAAPASAGAHALLGVLLAAGRRDDEARASLERALYLDPAREDALDQLALLCERVGDAAAADRYRRRARRAAERP